MKSKYLSTTIQEYINEQISNNIWYHGTDEKFELPKFINEGREMGFHLGSYEQALNSKNISKGYYPKYINKYSVKNLKPFRIKDLSFWTPELIADELIVNNYKVVQSGKGRLGSKYYTEEDIKKFLLDNNYNSFIYKNEYEGDSDSIIVLDSSQLEFLDREIVDKQNESKSNKTSTESLELHKLLNKLFLYDITVSEPYDPLYETIDISIKNINILKDLFNYISSNNWYISSDKMEHSKRIEIRPIYSKGLVEENPSKLYHATLVSNIDNILKEGLLPKSLDIRHKYPPRIYVTDKITSAKILAKELKRWKGGKDYTIIEIDTNNLVFDLYKDMTSAHSGNYYIQDMDKIPSKNIKKTEIII